MSERDIGEEYLETLNEPLRNGRLRVDNDFFGLLDKIWDRFPFVGSTIGWSSVPSSVSGGKVEGADSGLRFQEWFAAVAQTKGLGGIACVVGDGPVELGIVGALPDVVDNLPALTDLPQHTYVMSYPDCEWCACLSFEGCMDFGYAVR